MLSYIVIIHTRSTAVIRGFHFSEEIFVSLLRVVPTTLLYATLPVREAIASGFYRLLTVQFLKQRLKLAKCQVRKHWRGNVKQ